MATSALKLSHVDAFYGDSHVLGDVSFELGEARMLGLLGRNGAGKSTCMNVTVGLLPPRRGGSSPIVTFMQVDLPAPLRPSKPSMRASPSSKEMSPST